MSCLRRAASRATMASAASKSGRASRRQYVTDDTTRTPFIRKRSGEKADRPGAEDQDLVADADVGEVRRVDADGERFREHREVEIEPGRHAIEEPRRHLDHLRETARCHAAENTDLRAEVRLAAATT